MNGWMVVVGGKYQKKREKVFVCGEYVYLQVSSMVTGSGVEILAY